MVKAVKRTLNKSARPSIDGMSVDEVTGHPQGIGWKSALDRLQGVTACNYSNVVYGNPKTR